MFFSCFLFFTPLRIVMHRLCKWRQRCCCARVWVWMTNLHMSGSVMTSEKQHTECTHCCYNNSRKDSAFNNITSKSGPAQEGKTYSTSVTHGQVYLTFKTRVCTWTFLWIKVSHAIFGPLPSSDCLLQLTKQMQNGALKGLEFWILEIRALSLLGVKLCKLLAVSLQLC